MVWSCGCGSAKLRLLDVGNNRIESWFGIATLAECKKLVNLNVRYEVFPCGGGGGCLFAAAAVCCDSARPVLCHSHWTACIRAHMHSGNPLCGDDADVMNDNPRSYGFMLRQLFPQVTVLDARKLPRRRVAARPTTDEAKGAPDADAVHSAGAGAGAGVTAAGGAGESSDEADAAAVAEPAEVETVTKRGTSSGVVGVSVVQPRMKKNKKKKKRRRTDDGAAGMEPVATETGAATKATKKAAKKAKKSAKKAKKHTREKGRGGKEQAASSEAAATEEEGEAAAPAPADSSSPTSPSVAALVAKKASALVSTLGQGGSSAWD